VDSLDFRALLAVVIGSAIGGGCRYLLGHAAGARFGHDFPYGTLAINVIGSFLIGVVAELSVGRTMGVTPMVRLFLATGVLGGFTTFSAFSLDTIALLERGAFVAGSLYVSTSVALGIAAAAGGQFLTRIAVR
jgi:CrcB protein